MTKYFNFKMQPSKRWLRAPVTVVVMIFSSKNAEVRWPCSQPARKCLHFAGGRRR